MHRSCAWAARNRPIPYNPHSRKGRRAADVPGIIAGLRNLVKGRIIRSWRSEVILPRVDMDMATGTISVWHVKDGDKVKKGAGAVRDRDRQGRDGNRKPGGWRDQVSCATRS
jgi:multidrug efflux pump subunit AcrA (membrane-fusion protein)